MIKRHKKKMTTAKKKNYSCGDTEASTVGLERGGVGEGGAWRGGTGDRGKKEKDACYSM